MQATVFFPVIFQENEAAIEFAARVKADICKKGGLVDLPWQVFNHATIHNIYILKNLRYGLPFAHEKWSKCSNEVYSVWGRDGMIKRPGNEGYLNKLIEEERKSYSLQLADS